MCMLPHLPCFVVDVPFICREDSALQYLAESQTVTMGLFFKAQMVGSDICTLAY